MENPNPQALKPMTQLPLLLNSQHPINGCNVGVIGKQSIYG